MVTRTSQELQLNGAAPVQAEQSRIGLKSPDYGKFGANSERTAPSNPESSTDRVLSMILNAGGKLAQTAWQAGQEEAYLQGAAQVGTIKSEAELQGNPLTANWQTAGYRDTVGRVAAADREVQISSDMIKMREKSPEEYAEYLAEQRRKLMPQWEGMSRNSRENQFAQTMLTERSAITKHKSEHYKFIVGQEQKSIRVGFDAYNSALTQAKGDGEVYAHATDAAFGYAYTNIVRNNKLPTNLRAGMVQELAEFALRGDNMMMYEKMHKDTITLPDGTKGTMLSMLGWDDRVKLSGQYSESLKRTEAFRQSAYVDDKAFMQAGWANPDTPLDPIDTVRNFKSEAERAGFMTPAEGEAFMKDYYTQSVKKSNKAVLAAAAANGDSGTIWNMKSTITESVNAWVDVVGSKMSLPDATNKMLVMGVNTGNDMWFKKVGEVNKAAFAQIGRTDEIDPTNAASVSGIMQRMDAAERNGQTGVYAAFLSSFDADTQAKILYMRDSLRQNGNPVMAAEEAAKRMEVEAKLTPAMRLEVAQGNAKDDLKAVADLDARGMWGTLGLKIQAGVGIQSAAQDLAIRPRTEWFENSVRVAEVEAHTKIAFNERLQEVSRGNPYMPIGGRVSMAKAALANSTVMTQSGPLYVPPGVSPQAFFGVGADVSTDRIGLAMDEYLKPAEGSRLTYQVSGGVSPKVMFKELGEDGELKRAGTLNPKDMAGLVQMQRDRDVERYKRLQGEGVTRSSTDSGSKLSVNFNGDNTANIDPQWVFNYRDSLVKNEGIRDKVYKDTKGNDTIGVGIFSKKYWPKVDENGVASPEEIARTFREASNDAAQSASALLRRPGMPSDENAFKLFGNLAYQSGVAFGGTKAYKPLLESMQRGDYASADAALKASPAYRSSGDSRKAFYSNTLKAAMKG